MARRLLITGDREDIEALIRRIARERDLTVTRVEDQAAGRGAVETGAADVASVGEDEWTGQDDHDAYERQRRQQQRQQQQQGEEYAGRYIAMYRGEVIGVGESVREAAREGLERIDHREALFVMKAGEQLPGRLEEENDSGALHRIEEAACEAQQGYRRIPEHLVQEHRGEYVALYDGKAVSFGETPADAVKAGCERLGRDVRFFVHRVGEPVEDAREAPSSFRIDAPRRTVERE